ncbi:ABC transporter permease subunit [Agrobacterium sp. SHOUNA12C]|uniref:ABC transporter n=2 Tax=Rhizobium rhizogenes TaxID=359 RepID=B9JH93_RHIR8|nr:MULTISPECIES: ABC transporter permease subunit [Rhizobium]ACM27090.1 ABC transporter [Rhizobium rhizogenes K84]KAA6490105.1 acriflavin resistance protein [Agrobacterium sp. ICMP 7243]MCJ9719768.1 ABC transporter permease subunit [Agrobacterium sp. BETTINA12B]MCJ9755297.1 ABC transporter permease subunit [Agrobacterium sp. SHOUNA12C]OCJ05646.1 acriflavin resistance protein [Agrobacterium sp. 13-626]OCJ14812.1 acriflavin resistance protein [Agrobacterium sp. B133/95]OCJ26143.1 acriflavin re
MSTVTTSTISSAPLISKRAVIDWLGIAPFLLFALLFLIFPTIYLVAGAFLTPDGSLTLKNIADLFTPSIMNSYWISIKVSVVSALGGALIGFYLAWALVMGGLPAWVRHTFLTFSGVASNFAGVPLAFAFIATIGRLGLVTVLMVELFGFNLYSTGFNLYSFIGLTITYMYFQIPLMVLIITPALDGMKKEWREAASILGATNGQYWLMVALPILWPSLLGTTLLLFANAFGAIATAIALTGSSLNIVPIQLYAQIRGDVLHNANLGYAMALGMIVITGISNVIYILMRMRAERWQK